MNNQSNFLGWFCTHQSNGLTLSIHQIYSLTPCQSVSTNHSKKRRVALGILIIHFPHKSVITSTPCHASIVSILPQRLFDFNKQKPRSRMSLCIKQIQESIALLQTIEPYTGPRGQLVLCVLVIFDFESGKQVEVSVSRVGFLKKTDMVVQ